MHEPGLCTYHLLSSLVNFNFSPLSRYYGGVYEPRPLAYSMRFTFWLSDATGEIPVTLWNRRCKKGFCDFRTVLHSTLLDPDRTQV